MNLGALFRRLQQFLELKALTRKLRLEVRFQGPPQAEVLTDKRRVMQVLLNLCYNAIKYTFCGGVEVTGRFLEDRKLRIEVADTGIGIDPQKLESVCAMFGMVDTKASSHETGMF